MLLQEKIAPINKTDSTLRIVGCMLYYVIISYVPTLKGEKDEDRK